jgi:hypothetical protein
MNWLNGRYNARRIRETSHPGESNIDAYHNEATGRTAYALIKERQRIFGADNTGGWHWHPFDAPDEHVTSADSVPFEAFLDQIERWIKAQ